jgi:hypothetical protein
LSAHSAGGEANNHFRNLEVIFDCGFVGEDCKEVGFLQGGIVWVVTQNDWGNGGGIRICGIYKAYQDDIRNDCMYNMLDTS